MKKFLALFVNRTEGQDLIEYSLIASLIALGGVTGLAILHTSLAAAFDTISTALGPLS